jgi:hypothetical protein
MVSLHIKDQVDDDLNYEGDGPQDKYDGDVFGVLILQSGLEGLPRLPAVYDEGREDEPECDRAKGGHEHLVKHVHIIQLVVICHRINQQDYVCRYQEEYDNKPDSLQRLDHTVSICINVKHRKKRKKMTKKTYQVSSCMMCCSPHGN